MALLPCCCMLALRDSKDTCEPPPQAALPLPHAQQRPCTLLRFPPSLPHSLPLLPPLLPAPALCLLQEKLNLLERLDCFDGVQESACMREFTRHRVCETY